MDSEGVTGFLAHPLRKKQRTDYSLDSLSGFDTILLLLTFYQSQESVIAQKYQIKRNTWSTLPSVRGVVYQKGSLISKDKAFCFEIDHT